ncbi:sugar phosphate nucleotidyltransferase [Halegenticoccus soli]|uniref:sugar phosphate nucleotidyltransferase n=1 Tax=Halegenticoccus soli TaxID=1985678 RepID=UPI000C6E2531|nr:sugar phosphate nucleotidyltransferase [Halegenticoccus soli]
MDIESAVVLAAGEGTRLRPLTKHRPKPMLPAANRPILEYVFDALIDAGVEDLHLVVGYKRDRVQNHFGAAYRDRPITYHVQGKQLGSGHALLQASHALDADFLVVNGDQIVREETVTAVREAHTVEDVATLAVIESEEAPNYGAVKLDGDRVVEFTEKPRSDSYRLLNAGVYVFAPSFFVEVESTPRQHGELSLSDSIAQLVENGSPVRGVLTDGIWEDATYPWDLLSLARKLMNRGLVEGAAGPNAAVVPGGRDGAGGPDGAGGTDRTDGAGGADEPGRVDGPEGVDGTDGASETAGAGRTAGLRGAAALDRSAGADGVYVDRTATVHPDATLQGPAIVGPDSVIGPAAVVGPNTALGRNVTVEAGAVVRGSVVDVDSRVGPNATLVDCVTGEGVQVGAGTVAPGGSADVRIGTRIHEGCQLGAVIADRARLDGGATVEPGSLVGPHASVRTGAHVRGDVDEGAEVRR